MDRKVLGIHRAASGRHQSAGTIPGCSDLGVTDIYCRSFAVREHRVSMFSIRINYDIRQIQCRSICSKNSGIVAIEIRFVAFFRVAGFGDVNIGIRCSFPVCLDGMFTISAIGDLFICGKTTGAFRCGRFRLCIFTLTSVRLGFRCRCRGGCICILFVPVRAGRHGNHHCRGQQKGQGIYVFSVKHFRRLPSGL